MVAEKLIKACGVTSKGRMTQLPDVPSLPDKLGPQLDVVYWQGMFAPAGTPSAILDKISASGIGSLTPQERLFLSNFVPPDDRKPS